MDEVCCIMIMNWRDSDTVSGKGLYYMLYAAFLLVAYLLIGNGIHISIWLHPTKVILFSMLILSCPAH